MVRTACTEPQCLYKGDLYLYLFVLINYKYFLQDRMYACTRLIKPPAVHNSREDFYHQRNKFLLMNVNLEID